MILFGRRITSPYGKEVIIIRIIPMKLLFWKRRVNPIILREDMHPGALLRKGRHPGAGLFLDAFFQ